MLFKQLALAATAAAILVVPETSDVDDTIFRALPMDVDTFEVPSTAFSQSVDVPCTKCRGRDTQLKMNFAIDDHKLMLNGFELYPNANPWRGDLMASVTSQRRKSRNVQLGYGLSVRPEGMDEAQHLEVIGVELRVIEVGRHFVEDIPLVKIKLVKAPNNELIIGNVEVTESPIKSDCKSAWCIAKDKFYGAWYNFKGSFKSCEGTKEAWDFKHSTTKEFHHGPKGGPGHPGHPHGHHGGHRGHKHDKPRPRFYHRIGQFVAWAVFAVIMGVVAGLGIAAISITILTFVASCLRSIRNEPLEEASLGAAYKADVIEIVIDQDEKSGLMEEGQEGQEGQEEAPPKYDDAQA